MPAQRVEVREIVIIYGLDAQGVDKEYLGKLANAMPPGVLVVSLPQGVSVESLNSEDMAKFGWYRKE